MVDLAKTLHNVDMGRFCTDFYAATAQHEGLTRSPILPGSSKELRVERSLSVPVPRHGPADVRRWPCARIGGHHSLRRDTYWCWMDNLSDAHYYPEAYRKRSFRRVTPHSMNQNSKDSPSDSSTCDTNFVATFTVPLLKITPSHSSVQLFGEK